MTSAWPDATGFVAKFDAEGVWVWDKTFTPGSEYGDAEPFGLVLDDSRRFAARPTRWSLGRIARGEAH